MRAKVCATSFAVALALSPVSTTKAHGPQLQITRDNDKITTRRLFLDGPYHDTSSAKAVYVIPLLETGGEWYARPNNAPSATLPGLPKYLSGPGIAYGSDQADGGPRAFAGGQHFDLNLIAGLKYWNGSAFVDPGLEQIEAYRSTGTPAVTNDGLLPSTPATMTFGNVDAMYNSEAHGSASFRLLGDGSSALAPSDDGVYLLSMTFSSTEPGLAASDSFYFVLHKNASAAQVQAAVAGLGFPAALVQNVPEPSSLALAVGIFVIGFRWFRRR